MLLNDAGDEKKAGENMTFFIFKNRLNTSEMPVYTLNSPHFCFATAINPAIMNKFP